MSTDKKAWQKSWKSLTYTEKYQSLAGG